MRLFIQKNYWAILFFVVLTSCNNYEEVIKKHPNGKISEHYYENVDGERDGAYLKYDEQGQLVMELHYRDGVLDSTYRIYYLDLNNFKDSFTGLSNCLGFNDSIRRLNDSDYQTNMSGHFISYLIEEGSYVNGQKNGPFTLVYGNHWLVVRNIKTGLPRNLYFVSILKGLFDDGQMKGKFELYRYGEPNSDGCISGPPIEKFQKVKSLTDWKLGDLTSTIQFDNVNGDGKEEVYFNGRLSARGPLCKGFKCGRWTNWRVGAGGILLETYEEY